jgi:hypothetical protein
MEMIRNRLEVREKRVEKVSFCHLVFTVGHGSSFIISKRRLSLSLKSPTKG